LISHAELLGFVADLSLGRRTARAHNNAQHDHSERIA
jgi:hypothetical protein